MYKEILKKGLNSTIAFIFSVSSFVQTAPADTDTLRAVSLANMPGVVETSIAVDLSCGIKSFSAGDAFIEPQDAIKRIVETYAAGVLVGSEIKGVTDILLERVYGEKDAQYEHFKNRLNKNIPAVIGEIWFTLAKNRFYSKPDSLERAKIEDIEQMLRRIKEAGEEFRSDNPIFEELNTNLNHAKVLEKQERTKGVGLLQKDVTVEGLQSIFENIDKTDIGDKRYARYKGTVFLPRQEGELIIIGDTHGDVISTKKLLQEAKVFEDDSITVKPGICIVFLGDYSQNGLNSVGNLTYVLKLRNKNPNNVVLLSGNHERKESIETALLERYKTHWNNVHHPRKPEYTKEWKRRVGDKKEYYNNLRLELMEKFGVAAGEPLQDKLAEWGLDLPYICFTQNGVMVSYSIGLDKKHRDGAPLTLLELAEAKEQTDKAFGDMWYEPWKKDARPDKGGKEEYLEACMCNQRKIKPDILKPFKNLGVKVFVVGHAHYRSGEIGEGGEYVTIISSDMHSPDAPHYMFQEMYVERLDDEGDWQKKDKKQPKGEAFPCYASFDLGSEVISKIKDDENVHRFSVKSSSAGEARGISGIKVVDALCGRVERRFKVRIDDDVRGELIREFDLRPLSELVEDGFASFEQAAREKDREGLRRLVWLEAGLLYYNALPLLSHGGEYVPVNVSINHQAIEQMRKARIKFKGKSGKELAAQTRRYWEIELPQHRGGVHSFNERPQQKPKISVDIAVMSARYLYLVKRIEELKRFSRQRDLELVVCIADSENFSQEKWRSLKETISTCGFPVKVVFSKKNTIATNRNLASSVSSGEYRIFLDDDVQMVGPVIESLVRVLEEYPEVGVVSIPSYEPSLCTFRPRWHNLKYPLNKNVVITNTILGMVMATREEIVQALPFVKFWPNNGEDRIFCRQVHKMGFFSTFVISEDGYLIHETEKDWKGLRDCILCESLMYYLETENYDDMTDSLSVRWLKKYGEDNPPLEVVQRFWGDFRNRISNYFAGQQDAFKEFLPGGEYDNEWFRKNITVVRRAIDYLCENRDIISSFKAGEYAEKGLAEINPFLGPLAYKIDRSKPTLNNFLSTDSSFNIKSSSAEEGIESDLIRPSLPMTIEGLKAYAGYGHMYTVDVKIGEDGLIRPILYESLEIEDSCFDRYKNIRTDIIRQLREKGYLIEERKVSGKIDEVDYYVLFVPFVEDFSIPKPVVHVDETVFRRDVRAKASQLSNEVCYNIGRSFATLLRESTDKEEIWVPIGGDIRISTPRVYYYFVRGLMDSGINVYSLGTVPTPTIYFAADSLKTEGYAIVTGSHNPPEDNGIKFGIGGVNLDSKQIAWLKEIFYSGQYIQSTKRGKIVDKQSFLDTYVEFLIAYSLATKEEWEKYIIKGDNIEAGIKAILKIHEGEMPLKGRKVAADCGNGTAGYLPQKIWAPLGTEVGLLYPEADGNFPHHIPNPEVPENLGDLVEFVQTEHYELGFAFDTDVDRLGAVDPMMLTGEDIYCIIAKYILKDNPGAKFIVESKVSYTLMDYIKRHSGKVVMSGVGSTNIKNSIYDEGAIMGGETSGHMYMQDNSFRDDGLFTATALLKIMGKTGKTLRELLSDVHYYYESPEIRLFLRENPNKKIMPELRKMYQGKKGYEIIDVDGIRVELKDDNGKWLGWFLVRASATEPKITIRFEGHNEHYYNRMGKELFGFLSRYDVVEYGKYSEVALAILSGRPAVKVIPTPANNTGGIKPSSAGDTGDIEKTYTSPIELAKHIVSLSSERIDVTSAKKDLAAIHSEFEKMEVDFTTKPQIMEGVDFESLLPSCLLNFYLDPEDKESILTTPEYWRLAEYIESKRTKPEKGKYDIDPVLAYSDPRYIEDLLSEEDVADIERLCYCPSFLIRRKAIRCLGIIHNIRKALVSKNRLLAVTIDALIQDVLGDIYYLERAFKDTGFLRETGINIFGRPIEKDQVKQVRVELFGTGTEKLIYKISVLLKDKPKPLVFVIGSIRPNNAATRGWETDRLQGADRRIITMSHQNWRGLIKLKNSAMPTLGGIVDFKITEPVVTVETYVNEEDGGIPGKLYLGREKEVVLYSVEFIEGETLDQILRDPGIPYRNREDMAVEAVYSSLKIWLDTMNKDRLGVVLLDPDPSNFIYRKGEFKSIDNERLVYGYTFEECVREVLEWMKRQELDPLILSKALLKLADEALRRRINLTPSERVLQARDEAILAAVFGRDMDTRFTPGARTFDINEIVGHQRMGESIQTERAAYVNIRQAA